MNGPIAYPWGIPWKSSQKSQQVYHIQRKLFKITDLAISRFLGTSLFILADLIFYHSDATLSLLSHLTWSEYHLWTFLQPMTPCFHWFDIYKIAFLTKTPVNRTIFEQVQFNQVYWHSATFCQYIYMFLGNGYVVFFDFMDEFIVWKVLFHLLYMETASDQSL